MGRSRTTGSRMEDNLLLSRNQLGVAVQTLTGNLSIPTGSPHVLFLDPGGAARNVLLPASPRKGDWFLIHNIADAAEVITVQTSAGGALTPTITPAQSEAALLVYSGDATVGWRGVVMIGA